VLPEPAAAEAKQVAEYAREFSISKATAEDRLATQKRGVGIVEKLEAALGKNYAGVWFDNATGEFVIPQVPSASRANVKSTLAASGLGASETRQSSAKFTWEELEQAQRDLDLKLKPQIERDVVQTAPNPRTNAVQVLVAEAATETDLSEIQRLQDQASVAVEVTRIASPRFTAKPVACNTTTHSCDKPFRGGVYIDSTAASCSAGFRATGNVSGSRYMLTAGHCLALANVWSAYTSTGQKQTVGAGEEASFPVNDWAKVNMDGGYWDEGASSPSTVINWANTQNIGIAYESLSYVGESVCHSGQRTGTSCGVVTKINQTVNYPQGLVYHMTEVKGWCSYYGDSGGPVWNGNTALGLVSGGMMDIDECGGGVGWYAEVVQADEAMGVTVASRVAVPPGIYGVHADAGTRSVTLRATIDGRQSNTEYRFEYGPTASYGSAIPITAQSIGWGVSEVTQFVAGAEGVYHFRVAATNQGGTTYSPDAVVYVEAMPATSNPSVFRVSPFEVDAYWRGSDGIIRGDYNAGAGWKGPFSVPTNAAGAAGALAAIQTEQGGTQLYWRGTDGKIYGTVSTGGGWQNPIQLPTNSSGAASDPVLMRVSASELDVFWRGTDGKIYGDTSSPTGWKGVYAVPTNAAGAAGGLAAVQTGPGKFELYWRGTDGKIYGTVSTGGAWQTPVQLPTNSSGAASDPLPISVSASELDVFWRGTDGKIYGTASAGAGWQNPIQLPTNPAGAAGGLAGVKSAAGNVEIYWRGADEKLYGDASSPSGWKGPYPVPTNVAGAAGDPSLAKISPTVLNAYWFGNDGRIWGDSSGGAGWEGPYLLP